MQILSKEHFLTNDEGTLYMDMETLGKCLGYNHPRKSIHAIWQRNIEDLRPFSVVINLGSTDGKSYQKRIFSEEGCYVVAMLSNTTKAREFRQALAVFLKNYRLELMHQSRQKGFDALGRVMPLLIRKKYTIDKLKSMKFYRENGLSQAATARAFKTSIKSMRKIEKSVFALIDNK